MKTISGVLLGVIILFAIIYFSVKDSSKVIETNAKIEVIQTKIDSLDLQTAAYKLTIDSLKTKQILQEKQISIYKLKLDQLNSKLVINQKQSHEKIINVSHYNYAELDSFFAKRYFNYTSD